VPIDGYVADFLCFDARLIVELDGEPHFDEERRRKDTARDLWLSSQGFRVMRFMNDEMFGNPLRVMSAILEALEAPSLGSR
jgi:BirA family biotin operon repressor/biotin-[acetyl-CoA-carboxylase] ligase